MNYQKHYATLIFRAKHRIFQNNQYFEKHHIIPRCLGGNNDTNNIVNLTGREHFIAHQLLIKIYPNNPPLIRAANMMCSFNANMLDRSNNRLYEWLRIKLSELMKLQTGEQNSQYGTIWIYNDELKLNKKINLTELEQFIIIGWKRGRKINWEEILPKKLKKIKKKVTRKVWISNILKKLCYKIDINELDNYLSDGWEKGEISGTQKVYKLHRCKTCNEILPYDKRRKIFCSKKCRHNARPSAFDGRELELIVLYSKLGSLNKALKEMGFPGAVGGWYHRAKQILNK